jgi:glycosyltransferase involved in cell wall biosynthesis
MKICHVITRMIIGGAQENTALTCAGLHARGHDVTLITGPEAGPEGSMLAEVRRRGHGVWIVESMCRSVDPLGDWRTRRTLAEMFRELRPEVVHTHSSKAGILGRLAARDAGVPIVVHTIHGMSFNRTQSWPVRTLYRRLEIWCSRFTDRIVCVADAMARQAEAAGLRPRTGFTTVYSGMETDWFSPERYDGEAVRARWGWDRNHVVVGTIARLFRNKGYEQLIPAMADAADRDDRLRFVWIGDGVERKDYERQLAELGIRNRVRLAGLVPPNEVAGLLAGTDLLVHASQWEGLPRAAVQALLMARPVISFDIDGAPEVVIPGKTGVLVPLNAERGLAEGMVRLAGDPAGREAMGRTGRQLCLERFDAKRMVEQLEKIYQELVGRQ